jgi:hypothetical protein
MVRLFTDDRATRSGGKTKPNFCCALLEHFSIRLTCLRAVIARLDRAIK